VTQPIPTWIVGASGLLAGELARLIAAHPEFELTHVVSREGRVALSALHPHLSSSLVTIAHADAPAELARQVADAPGDGPAVALFLGLPHGQSAKAWTALSSELGDAAQRVAVVDLSADYRIADAELFERWYGIPHPDPNGDEGFAYGLPEFHRGRIQESTRVAAPGCFATALQLAVLPAAYAGALDASSPWVLQAATGSSGSGVAPKPGTHHPFRHGSFKAYSPNGHRHEAELAQALGARGIEAPLHFLPHSGPWSRGIHLSASLPLATELTLEAAHALYAEAYDGEPFVELLQPGGIPEMRAVVGSNRASLGVHVRGSVLTVLAAIDNTIKGGSGQALQCMNLLFGLDEAAGLPRAGLGY